MTWHGHPRDESAPFERHPFPVIGREDEADDRFPPPEDDTARRQVLTSFARLHRPA